MSDPSTPKDLLLGMTHETALIVLPFIGVALSSFVREVSGWIQSKASREADNRKLKLEIAIKTAIEHWQHAHERAKAMWEAHQIESDIPPIESFIVHSTIVFDILCAPGLNEHNAADRLKQVHRIALAIREEVSEYDKAIKKLQAVEWAKENPLPTPA